MIRINRYILGALVVAFALSTAAARADEWSKTYSIANRADLQVQTDDGSVTVNSGDQKQIVAHVSTIGYKLGPNDVRIEESQSGDHVTVAVKMPHQNWNLFGGHHEIRVQLTVPHDLDMDVSTGDGAVDVQPVNGRIHIRTGDGSIRADGVKGDISIHTGDGGIDAHALEGTLVANSGDGSIRLNGRFDGLEVNTGDGSVDAEAAAGSKMTSPWSIHSGDGSINLRVPPDLKAYVDLKTGDGSINLDVPVSVEGVQERSHVRGNMNGGGGELKITSGDGSIHLMHS
jgi:Putative adhesin